MVPHGDSLPRKKSSQGHPTKHKSTHKQVRERDDTERGITVGKLITFILTVEISEQRSMVYSQLIISSFSDWFLPDSVVFLFLLKAPIIGLLCIMSEDLRLLVENVIFR